MGCGGSKVDGEEGEDDIDVPDDIPRTHSQVTGVGMDFFGDLNAELETDINDIIKAESEVKLRDEQRRDTEATFKKYDTDGNGRLEPPEIARALKDLGLNLPLTQMDEYVHNVIHIYDDNNDGFLRMHEFEKLYTVCMATEAVRGKYVEKVLDIATNENQVCSLAQHAFDKFDTDNSGALEIAELAEVLLHMLPLKHNDFTEDQWVDLIQKVYLEGDADGDGKIDFEEFVKLYKKLLLNEDVREQFSRGCLLKYNSATARWGIDGLDVLEAEMTRSLSQRE